MPSPRPLLDRANSLVLLLDVQERLAPAMTNFAPVEKYCRALVQAAYELSLPVIATEQYPKGLGPTVSSLRQVLRAAPFEKTHFSCGADAAISRALATSGRKQVVMAGVETHVCVFQTARDLVALGYEVQVCADAVSSRTEEHRRVGLELCREAGALVTTVETAIFDLLRQSGTPEFKKVAPFVK